MNEIQTKIMQAIAHANPKKGYEFDAITVAQWYRQTFDVIITNQTIAQQLPGCELPRRCLSKAEQWRWFKLTGHHARTLYQVRQTGFDAYPESIAKQKQRQKNTQRAAHHAEEAQEGDRDNAV